MPQVMALKWRPQVFADMVGQEHITRTLQNAIRSNRVAHAYIFAGPRGVGKTTTARIFAKALNCRNPKDTEPCNACDLCEEVNQGSSLDVIEIDAASVNGIDDIRDLQQRVANSPAKSKYKVYIFDEAHRISKAAFDAFLKTLEEPPEHVIFILASTEIHAFPATVQSRCQRYEFRSMGLETTLKQLRRISDAEKIEIDDKALYQVARSASGSMRDAQRNLDQLVAFSGKKVTLDDVRLVLGTIEEEIYLKLAEAAVTGDAPAALIVVKGIIEGGKDLGHFYAGLLETFRHLAVARAYPSSAQSLIPLAPEEVQKLVGYASQMEEAQILSSLRLLIEQEWAVRHSANPQIILETVLLELCRLKQLTSVGDLLRQVEKGIAPSLPPSSYATSLRPDSGRQAASADKPPVPRSLGTGGAQAVPSPPVPRSASAGGAPKPAYEAAPVKAPVAQEGKPSGASAQEGEPVLAVDEIEEPTAAEKNPDMAKLMSQWRELLEKIGAQNKSLKGVLEDTHPKTLELDTLIVACKGPFHHEQLSKPENKALVEKLLGEVLGRKINLAPVLSEGSPTTPEKPAGPRAPKSLSATKVDVEKLEKDEPLVAATMKMFGAKIVEVKRNNPKQ